ncbi:MAG: hypothetical protein QM500_07500 [Methylococcales bacterium]
MNEQSSLKTKLITWLSKEGYPLEMQVASAARKYTGFDIRQGWHYKDPESGNSREIDIICTASEPKGIAEINFVIECKASKKPWVLFSSDDAASSFHRLRSFGLFSKEAHSAVAKSLFPSDLDDDDYSEAMSIPWLWKEGLVAYSVSQAFDGNKDAPYVASLSSVKAAIWLLSNSLWQSAKHRPYSVSFPIIVTSSQLFECALDENGDQILNEINHGHLFFKQHINDFTATCISIVNEKHIEVFMKECQEVADKIYLAMKSSMNDDWNKFLKEHK